jgi:ATP-dependent phosphofructokinase / diphosphate-dependent phosphofructokinase
MARAELEHEVGVVRTADAELEEQTVRVDLLDGERRVALAEHEVVRSRAAPMTSEDEHAAVGEREPVLTATEEQQGGTRSCLRGPADAGRHEALAGSEERLGGDRETLSGGAHDAEAIGRLSSLGAMRIGLLNGGGDCPGLNAVTRAVVRRGEGVLGHHIVGFRHGWRGVISGEVVELTVASTRGLLYRGGTVLGTSRTNPYKQEGAVDKVRDTLRRERIDVLIAVGGEDTLGVAHRLCDDGVRCVGVPKTIDNDLSATDYTFGFDTAVQIATEAIDRLHTTAESHDRVIIVEVMGRHAGWIALHSGLGGGADAILIPEVPFDLDDIVAQLEHRHARGVNSSIVVVAEGAMPREGTMATLDQELDEFGHVRLGGIAARIAPELEERTGFDTRVVVLGHLLRGGTPTAYDRILATRFGLAAVAAAHDRVSDVMVALRGTDIVRVPLGDAVGALKTVPPERFAEAEVFFG